MIVQDLFQQLTFEEFLNCLEQKINVQNIEQEQLKKVFKDLKECSTVKFQNNVLFAIRINEVEENRIDLFYFEKNNIPKDLQIYQTIEEMQENYQNQGISILGIDRYDLLGFEFAEICLEELTIPEIISELFFEFTFFGLDYENSKKKIKELQQELLESLDDIENENTIPFEEFMSELGIKDERTEEEKEQERKEILENCLKNINKTNRIILKYSQKE